MSDGIPTYLGSVGKGVGLVFGLMVAAMIASGILAAISPGEMMAGVFAFVAMGVGVSQAAWVVPSWRYYKKHGESETVKGILIAAAITFLLNAGCWGLIFGVKW